MEDHNSDFDDSDDESAPVFFHANPQASLLRALRHTLAGKLISRQHPHLSQLKSQVARAFGCPGRLKTNDHGSRLYSFEFLKLEDVACVMDGGPWYVAGGLLLVERMLPKVPIEDTVFSTSKLWVHIHDLPPMGFTDLFAEEVGKALGRLCDVELPSDMDNDVLSSFHRVPTVRRFLRIRVEINILRALKRFQCIKVEGDDGIEVAYTLRLSYERLPDVCYYCGILGHLLGACPSYNGSLPLPFGDWIRSDKFFRLALAIGNYIRRANSNSLGSRTINIRVSEPLPATATQLRTTSGGSVSVPPTYSAVRRAAIGRGKQPVPNPSPAAGSDQHTIDYGGQVVSGVSFPSLPATAHPHVSVGSLLGAAPQFGTYDTLQVASETLSAPEHGMTRNQPNPTHRALSQLNDGATQVPPIVTSQVSGNQNLSSATSELMDSPSYSLSELLHRPVTDHASSVICSTQVTGHVTTGYSSSVQIYNSANLVSTVPSLSPQTLGPMTASQGAILSGNNSVTGASTLSAVNASFGVNASANYDQNTAFLVDAHRKIKALEAQIMAMHKPQAPVPGPSIIPSPNRYWPSPNVSDNSWMSLGSSGSNTMLLQGSGNLPLHSYMTQLEKMEKTLLILLQDTSSSILSGLAED